MHFVSMIDLCFDKCKGKFELNLEKPYIKQNDALQYTTSTGKKLEIPCHTTGKPQPKIIWTMNGKPISSDGQEYEILVS